MGKKNKRDFLKGLKINPWEIEKEVKKFFNYKDCLVPESFKDQCSRKIVKAHTVPKSGSLKEIAHEGHVYSGQFDFTTLLEQEGVPKVSLVGINEASTFNGFCTNHDSKIFHDLEQKTFLGTKKQCFLIAFRALSRELYLKKSFVKTLDLYISLAKSKKIDPNLGDIFEALKEGAILGLRDLSKYKKVFD
ncbi:MAG: hypothetical protein V3R64_10125, partial [Sphingomonadales bacterium]